MMPIKTILLGWMLIAFYGCAGPLFTEPKHPIAELTIMPSTAEQGGARLELRVTNPTNKTWLISAQPSPNRGTPGPYLLYVGQNTLLVSWSPLPRPRGLSEPTLLHGAEVQALKPHGSLTLATELLPSITERYPYRSVYWDSRPRIAALFDTATPDRKRTPVPITKIIACVSAWDQDLFSADTNNPPVFIGWSTPLRATRQMSSEEHARAVLSKLGLLSVDHINTPEELSGYWQTFQAENIEHRIQVTLAIPPSSIRLKVVPSP